MKNHAICEKSMHMYEKELKGSERVKKHISLQLPKNLKT